MVVRPLRDRGGKVNITPVVIGMLILFVLAFIATARITRNHTVWATYIAWKIARDAKWKRDHTLYKAREHLVSRIDSGESVEEATRIFKEETKKAHHDYEDTVTRARELGRRLNGDHSEEIEHDA